MNWVAHFQFAIFLLFKRALLSETIEGSLVCDTLRCVADGRIILVCPVENASKIESVMLKKQSDEFFCTPEEYGHTDHAIWVNGCNGDFRVCFIRGFVEAKHIRCSLVFCESVHNKTIKCNIPQAEYIETVSVKKQFSSSHLCREIYDFGFHVSYIWVKEGCGAQFEVCYVSRNPVYFGEATEELTTEQSAEVNFHTPIALQEQSVDIPMVTTISLGIAGLIIIVLIIAVSVVCWKKMKYSQNHRRTNNANSFGAIYNNDDESLYASIMSLVSSAYLHVLDHKQLPSSEVSTVPIDLHEVENMDYDHISL